MVGVVHDIKANTCQYKTKKQTGQNHGQQGHWHKEQCCVQANSRAYENGRFEVELYIARLLFSRICKVVIYRRFEGVVKDLLFVIKAYFSHMLRKGRLF